MDNRVATAAGSFFKWFGESLCLVLRIFQMRAHAGTGSGRSRPATSQSTIYARGWLGQTHEELCKTVKPMYARRWRTG